MTAAVDLDSRAGVLAAARAARAAEMVAAAAQLAHAADWAAMHSVDSLDEAAAFGVCGVFGETVIPVAGPGAPLVGEFCVAELAAALGLPTESGRELLGEVIELEHR